MLPPARYGLYALRGRASATRPVLTNGDGSPLHTQQVCSVLFDVSEFAQARRSVRTLAPAGSFASADATPRRLTLLSVCEDERAWAGHLSCHCMKPQNQTAIKIQFTAPYQFLFKLCQSYHLANQCTSHDSSGASSSKHCAVEFNKCVLSCRTRATAQCRMASLSTCPEFQPVEFFDDDQHKTHTSKSKQTPLISSRVTRITAVPLSSFTLRHHTSVAIIIQTQPQISPHARQGRGAAQLQLRVQPTLSQLLRSKRPKGASKLKSNRRS